MKRLFEVNGEYFESKELAKEARGEGKPVKGEKGEVLYVAYPHTVAKGPDHIHYGTKDLTPNAFNGRRRRPASAN